MKKQPKRCIADEIIESLREFTEALRNGEDIGSTFNCRRVTIEAAPAEYYRNVAQVTRKQLRASQAIFAKFLGVSVQTVRAWEQGENVPSDIAKRFMDEIRHDPDYWRKRLREVVVVKKRKLASQPK